jgi:lauroyl/myristoyl acyltransferase
MPQRWTLHGLNNGAIFGATIRGVGALPRSVSYAIGRACSWLAWRMHRETREAIADNLRAVFPEEPQTALEQRARLTLRAYTEDVIDFIRALRTPAADAVALFDHRPEDAQLFVDLLAQGRGIILVTGHYGNWEAGGIFLRRVARLPLTIVAMTEANPEVNQLRRDIRDQLGADTLEVGRSLDAALQIRRRLADNRIVAMLLDRHLGRDRVGVQFLGRRAWFLKTPLLMGYMTGAPVVPCFVERTAPGRFSVRPGTPIVVSREGRRDESIQAAAQNVADQLGARVRAHPHQWYQFYRYWDAQRDFHDQLV